MVNPVTFPQAAGTTATYLHPLLQSAALQSTVLAAAAKPSEAAPNVTQVRQPAVPAVTAVQPTAAYAENLARDAATAVRTATVTAKTTRRLEQTAEDDAFAELARQASLDRASSQVGMLLTRAAAERRVAVTSGLPAARLAQLDTTTSRLYHALDVLV
ncbi:hypothetical protein Aab01nite_19980 [Paractinoplanes abujensis]|uniref:DNA primase n=1 Tax=Paractinoplanes abujensis TaxID=882441 RepID=A0A7W7G479_9ACTN|nr:hypothetical protein [Actinoplanes abujensis]MBB4697118.1 DNA primase [Actinoplanes abujensis]GID18408.1 hypothetical protein Aab01nite_19980 [Actinoplanes abujensis]